MNLHSAYLFFAGVIAVGLANFGLSVMTGRPLVRWMLERLRYRPGQQR